MHPTRSPRGISFPGIAYYPPKATNSMMLDYLTACFMDLESKYSNCGLLVLGDFKHLNDARLKSNFNLKQIENLPGKRQISSLSPNKDISKTSTRTLNLSPLPLSCPRLQKIMLFMIDFVMPAMLKIIDKRQYGTIPKSCTAHTFVNMLHNWYVNSNGNLAVIRVVLFDFRKGVRSY